LIIKLTESELKTITYLKNMFLNMTIPKKIRVKVWYEIRQFWRIIESKHNLSILNIKEMKPDGTLVLK